MEPVSPLRSPLSECSPPSKSSSLPPSVRSPPSVRHSLSVGYPDKFYLALRYSEEGPLAADHTLTDSDRLLLYALSQQAQFGPCKGPRPSMFVTAGKAKYYCWAELGNLSTMEAMFKFVQCVDMLAPDWRTWPPLELAVPPVVADDAAQPDERSPAAGRGGGEAPGAEARGGEAPGAKAAGGEAPGAEARTPEASLGVRLGRLLDSGGGPSLCTATCAYTQIHLRACVVM